MKYEKHIQGVLIAFSLALGGVAFAATPSASMLANTCAGCHGPKGNSHGPATPTISGISSEYFISHDYDPHRQGIHRGGNQGHGGLFLHAKICAHEAKNQP